MRASRGSGGPRVGGRTCASSGLRGAVLAGLAVLCLSATATATAATTKDRDGRIVFSCAPSSGQDQEICVVRPDGSGRRELTHNRSWDGVPQWTPDGRWIAFGSDRADGPGGDVHIFVMGANEAGVMDGGVSSAPGSAPVWSPDGRRIMFAALSESGPASAIVGLRIVDLHAEREFTSARPPANWPSWSSTDVIAFTGSETVGDPRPDNQDIFTVPASGATPTNLTAAFPFLDRYPDWSPDGQELAFASDRATRFEWEIYSMHADGSAQRRLTDSPGVNLDPAWSPDGKRIVFISTRDGDETGACSELYVMEADGSGPRWITFEGDFIDAPDWRSGHI